MYYLTCVILCSSWSSVIPVVMVHEALWQQGPLPIFEAHRVNK